MRMVGNVVVTARALAAFDMDAAQRKPRSGQILALYFMPSFANPNGTTVDGFSPGYTIHYENDRAFGEHWLMAHLPHGTAFRFMPMFDWRAEETYVLDRASGYTFSIKPKL